MNQQAIAAMRAVTVSREYGSGGGEIAARLAQQLNWQLVDHHIVVHAAQALGIRESVVRAYDEKTEDIFSRLMQWPYPAQPAEIQTYRETLRCVVLDAAKDGHTVIVGRAGQILLADRRDVLHIRMVAPLEQRVAYVVRREGLELEAARTRLQEKDRARARYLQTEFHHQSDDAHLYDLIINTAVLDLDSIVGLICQALEAKSARLNVPTEELGAAAGMARYPGQPADFPVPPSPNEL